MSGDRQQQRRGFAADWASTNPVLADGEIGIAMDEFELKIGDGVTPWNSLPNFTDFLTRVSKLGDIMTGRLQLPSLGVTMGDTLTLYQEGTSTLAKISVAEAYVNGHRVYTEGYPPDGGATMKYTEFLASGTFVVPAFVTTLKVTCVGGGGGSGGLKTVTSGTSYAMAAGGGAGGDVITKYVTVTPGDPISVVIGAGGVAGAVGQPGGHGGDTSFGSLVTALGGGAGGGYDDGAPITDIPDATGKAGTGGGSNSKSSSSRVFGGSGGGAGGNATQMHSLDQTSALSRAPMAVYGTHFGTPSAYGSGNFNPTGAGGRGVNGFGGGGSGGTAAAGSYDRQLAVDGGGLGGHSTSGWAIGQAGKPNRGGGAGGPAGVINSAGGQVGAVGGSGYVLVEWIQ